jgi:GNAT superfamily N-acetyltransferase
MTGGALTVRKAEASDAEGIRACLRAAFEPYRETYTDAAFEDTVLSAGKVHDRLAEMCLFVAVGPAGEIIGTVGCRNAGEGRGHIRGMAVHPDFLGRGVAQELLERAEAEVRSLGCSRMSLNTTEPLRRATRFYERNGFRPSGAVRDFFGMALYEYVKTLAPAQHQV